MIRRKCKKHSCPGLGDRFNEERLGKLRACLPQLSIAESLERRTLLSAVTWVGTTGDWGTASNWSDGIVPGGNDDVTINAGANVTISQGESANSITAASGSTLTLNSGTQLVVESSSTISGTFNWNGNIDVASGGTLTVAGSTNLTGLLPTGTVDNTGQMTANDGGLAGGNMTNSGAITIANGMVLSGSTFTNASSGIVNLTDNSGFLGTQAGGMATNANFINSGTFNQNGGTGTTTFSIHFEDVGGTINVSTGNLTLSGANGVVALDNSTLNVAAGSVLTLGASGANPSIFFAGALTGSGGGIVSVPGGTIVNNDPNDNQVNSTLDFPQGMLQVGDASIQGTPGLVPSPAITNTGFIDFAGSSGHVSLAMYNSGTVNVQGSSDLPLNFFVNNPSGVLNLLADVNLTSSFNAVAKNFQNFGTIRKSGTSGTSMIECSFLNQPGGALDIQTGTLSFPTHDIHYNAGPINIDANAVVNFDGSNVFVNGNFTSTGTGKITLSSGFFTGFNDSTATTDVVLDFGPNIFFLQGGDLVNGSFNNIVNEGDLYELNGGPLDNFINKGSFFIGGGQIIIAKGDVIDNAPGGLMDFTAPTSVVTGINAALRNQGKLLIDISANNTLDLATPFPGVDFITGEVEFDNSGTVEVASGALKLPSDAYGPTPGTLAAGQTYQVDAGASLITIAPNPITVNDGTLIIGGAGAFFPDISGLTTSNGTFAVGSGASFTTAGALTNSGTLTVGGQVTVNGNLTESGSSADLNFAVGAPPNTSGAPKLTVTGNATLAGNLSSTLVNGFAPSASDSYQVATFNKGAIGTFASTAGVGPTFSAMVNPTNIQLNGSASGAAALSVSSVTGPSAGSPGSAATITWQVTNTGSAPAGGAWHDSVYLTTDGTIDNASILLGRVSHTGPLAPLASYSGQLTTMLPAVPVGNYKIVVLADSGLVVPEISRAGNLGVSAPFAVNIPSLSLGVTTTGNVNVGQDIVYVLALTAGQTVNLSATFAVGTEADLYASYGAIPTTTSSDESHPATTATSANVLINAHQSGNYYILVHGREAAGSGPAFGLTPTVPGFSAQLITPSFGGNNGSVTVQITGSQLTANTVAALVNGNTTNVAVHTVLLNSTTLLATFNLTGEPTGTFNLMLTSGSETSTLPNAFTIQAPTGNGLTFDLVFPAVSRGDLINTAYLEYANTGNVDLPAPYFIVVGNNTKFRLVGQTAFTSTSIELLGISPTGDASVLAPGQTGSIAIQYTQTTIQGHQLSNISANLMDPSKVFNLSSLKADLQPVNEPTFAWSIIYQYFLNNVGTTVGGLSTVLRNAASALSAQGTYTPDVATLLHYALQAAGDFGQITRRYTVGAFGLGQANPFAEAITSVANGNVTITSGGREEVFLLQPNGTYQGINADASTLTFLSGIFTRTDPAGNVTVFNSNGTLNYFQDTNGNRLTAEYTSGLITSLVASNGDTTTISYNSAGRITQVADPEGRITTYAYDSTNMFLMSITTSVGITTFTYDTSPASAAPDALTSVTHSDGTVANYQYDSFGRLIAQSRNGGAQAITYTYDAAGNTVTTRDALGRTTTTARGLNDQTAEVENGLGNIARFAYDFNGRLTSQTNPGGFTTTNTYDAAGNITSTTDPNGNKTNFSYDPTLNRLLSLTDPNGNKTNYAYDSKGNLVSFTDAAGNITSYANNSLGLVTQINSPNSTGEVIAYNAANLVIGRTFSDGETINYTYDSHRNLLSADDSVTGNVTYTYDSADRQTSVTEPDGLSLTYSYNSFGKLSQTVDQTGFTTHYIYNSLQKLTQITDGSGNPITTYAYDASGELSGIDNSNGTFTTYTYDNAGRTASIVNHAPNSSVDSSFSYTYNADGQITSETTPQGTTTYAYDADGQLSRVGLPAGRMITYAYDAAGNRTGVSDSALTGAVVYNTNNLNEYVTVGGTTYVYDRDGNLTSKTDASGITTYTYNARAELATVTEPGHTFVYTYDALGNRISVADNGVITRYLIDPTGPGNVAGSFNSSGGVIDHYVQGVGLAGAVDASGNASFFDFDLSGNTADITNTSGAVSSSYTYLSFGQLLSSTGASNLFMYGGQFGVQNSGDGLYYMRARSYDPTTGRFTQTDPIGLAGGDANLYRFVGNDPVNQIDPFGTFSAYDFLVSESGLASIRPALQVGAENLVTILHEAAQGNLPSLAKEDAVALYNEAVAFWHTVRAGGNEEVEKIAWDLVVQADQVIVQVGARQAVQQTLTEVATAAPGLLQVGLSAEEAVAEADRFNAEFPDGIPIQVQEVITGTAYRNAVKLPLTQELLKNLAAQGITNPSDEFLRLALGVDAQLIRLHQTDYVNANDPNDIIGPVSYGAAGFVQPGNELPYEITFENSPTASAPAKVVTIAEQFDPNLDWTTFQLGSIQFGSFSVVVPPGLKSYDTSVSVSSTLRVDIAASLNVLTGLLTWTFTSIDPATGDIPAAALSGFLPPDADGTEGYGYVSYLIRPKASLTTSATFHSQASIVFDGNAAIDTPNLLNTIDAAAPTSSVTALPSTEPQSFTLNWSGQDDVGGSGIAFFNIYVSDNGGTFTPFLLNTRQTSATFTGQVGHTYSFYSVATDHVGNSEMQHAKADTQTMVIAVSGPGPKVTAESFGYDHLPYTISFTFNGDVSASLSLAAIKVQDLTSGTAVVPVSLSYDQATNTATFTLPAGLSDGNYQARLVASAVTDSSGNHLDGLGNGTAADFFYDFFSLAGDVNRDRAVNFQDLVTLARNYGRAGTYAQGDLDGSGTVDFADLVILARGYGHTLPVPPSPNAVEIDGARYTDDKNQTLSFTFSSDVSGTVSPAALTVSNTATGATVSPAFVVYDQTTNTASFLFKGALADGTYRATLSAATVADAAGHHLDGNGDGVPGDDFIFNFSSLLGDINGDGKVNFSDLVILARNYGQPGTYSQGDLDGDGKVDFQDLVILARNYGHSLPQPAPTAFSPAL